MHTIPGKVGFHATIARRIANIGYGDATGGFHTALTVEIPLIILAVLSVVFRLYSRLAIKRKLAIDDILIIMGTIAAICRTVISCIGAEDDWVFEKNGPSRASEVPFYQHIFERRIAYISAVTMIRLSVLAYYLRIFPPGVSSLRRGCYVLLLLTFALFLEVFVVLIYSCREIGRLWSEDWLRFSGSQCFSSATYSYSAAIGDSIVDSMIFALPVPYVWRLSKLKARQRIGLICIFSLGFIVCIVALLQIPFIRRREDDTTYFGTTVNLLIAVEISLAIVAASLPDLCALMARTFPNFSPQHHRSLATNARRVNSNKTGGFGQEPSRKEAIACPRAAFDIKRPSRKPDWLRRSIPASLMSTLTTQEESVQLDMESSNRAVSPLLPRLTRASERSNGFQS